MYVNSNSKILQSRVKTKSINEITPNTFKVEIRIEELLHPQDTEDELWAMLAQERVSFAHQTRTRAGTIGRGTHRAKGRGMGRGRRAGHNLEPEVEAEVETETEAEDTSSDWSVNEEDEDVDINHAREDTFDTESDSYESQATPLQPTALCFWPFCV